MYVIEIWGGEKIGTIIDALKARFGKIWLKLPSNTTNVAVSRELGMEAGIGILIKRIIKYYYYLGSKENEEIVKISWNYYIDRLEKREKLNLKFRVDKVERIIEKIGLKNVWKKQLDKNWI